MLVLSASSLVSGMRNIGMVEFEQDLRFGPIVVLALVRRVSSFVLTLALAWWYGSYWALLAGMVAGHMIDLLLSYRVSPYRPRFSLVAWRDLFSFSKWLLVNNMLSYAGSRGGDMVVGNRAGAAALGTYSVSLELSNLPTSEMVWPVMRAVFPGYAMMSSDPQRLAQGFLKVFSIVVLFALPAAAGIALLAEPIVAVLLGAKWSAAVPLIQVLAIAGVRPPEDGAEIRLGDVLRLGERQDADPVRHLRGVEERGREAEPCVHPDGLEEVGVLLIDRRQHGVRSAVLEELRHEEVFREVTR